MNDLEALEWRIGEFITGYDSAIVTKHFAKMEMENVFLRKTLTKLYQQIDIEDGKMIDMLSNELKEDRERKWIGISQQSEVRPLIAVWHGDFVEIKHNEEVLIQASYEAFDKATANEIVEIINRSNKDNE